MKSSPKHLHLFALICLGLFLLSPLNTQAEEKTLKVGVSLGEPFAAVYNDNYSGIAIDLWKKLADELNLKYQYIPMGEHIDEAVEKLSKGEIDILIGPIVSTYGRMKLVDFLQPYYVDQIGLIIPAKKVDFLNAFSSIFDSTITTALIVLGLFYVFYLHVYWYYEIRGRIKNKEGYWKGILESFWLHSLNIDLGQIPTHIRTRQSRFIWIILLALFFSSITASITSALTIALSHQYTSYSNIDEFKNKPVAAVINAAPYDIAKNQGFTNLVTVNDREEAIQLVLNGKVSAYVDYYPIANFYLNQHELTSQLTTGTNLVLERNTFSFALPLNDPLRHPLDLRLVSMQEYGLVKLICQKHLRGGDQGLNDCEI